MRPQSQFKYRIHSRSNTSLVLGGTKYISNGFGAALMSPTLGSLTTWTLVEDPKHPVSFTLRPAEHGYENSFLTWIADGNDQMPGSQ